MNTNIPWSSVFAFTLRGIWLTRNSLIFGKPHRLDQVFRNSLRFAKEYHDLAGDTTISNTRSLTAVKWEPPPIHTFKLNTDGSSLGNPGPSGAGSIIRDHEGKLISGSHRYIGHASIMTAELWALRDGLTIAKDLGIESIHVEVDSTSVITCVTNSLHCTNLLTPLVVDCRTLLDGFREISFRHAYREANKCADMLARIGSSFDQRQHSGLSFNDSILYKYSCMPNFMANLISDDLNGIPMYRAT